MWTCVVLLAAETHWWASEIFIRKEGVYADFVIGDLATEPVTQGLRESRAVRFSEEQFQKHAQWSKLNT